MGGQLHEVLAVLPSCKGAAQKILAETAKVFKDKSHHFEGSVKSYDPLNEGDPGLPDETSVLVTTVGEKLAHLAECYSPWLDVEFQIDETNRIATGTVEVEGLKIEHVPSTFLMQLDKRLSELRGVYDAIPTLDPKYEWSASNDKGKGIFGAAPETRNRTEKVPVHKILVPATDHHPAQVAGWNEDRVIGRFTTKRWTGAISPEQKYELLKRIDLLQRAVKRALSAANKAEHKKDRIGRQVFEFIHGDLPLRR